MGRRKGSKNKSKEEEPKKSDIVREVKEIQQVGHAVAISEPTWKPEPKAHVEKPSDSKKECSCGHLKETHYGGARGHCNAAGCACLEFK